MHELCLFVIIWIYDKIHFQRGGFTFFWKSFYCFGKCVQIHKWCYFGKNIKIWQNSFSRGGTHFFVKVLFVVENVFKFMNVALFVKILKYDRIDFQGDDSLFCNSSFCKSSTKRTFTKIGILIILKKELRKFWNQSNNIIIVDNYKRKSKTRIFFVIACF